MPDQGGMGIAGQALNWLMQKNPRYAQPEESTGSMLGRASELLSGGYNYGKTPQEQPGVDVPDAVRTARWLLGKENPPIEPMGKIAIAPGMLPGKGGFPLLKSGKPNMKAIKSVIEAAGGKMKGLSEGLEAGQHLVWFDEPGSGSTLMVPSEKFSAAEVRRHITDTQERFRQAATTRDTETIAKLHQEGQGGSTYNVASGQPVKQGYSVGIFPNKEAAAKTGRYTPADVSEGPPTAERIRQFIADPKRRELLENPALSADIWENKGKTFYNITATPSQEATATTLGHRAGQNTIFDLNRSQTMPVEPNVNLKQVRLSSIPELEQTVSDIKGRMKPTERSTEAYETGTLLKKSLGEKPGEATWYQSAQNVASMFRTPEDWNMFMRMYAATSPQQSSATSNVDAALKAFGMWKRGAAPAEFQRTFMKGHSGNLLRAMQDPGAEMTGPKVFQFNRALPSLREGLAKGDAEAVAFDRHMLDWYLPEGRVTNAAYREHINVGAQRVREDARIVGTTPQEYQETAWRGWLATKYGPDYSGIPPVGKLIQNRLGERGISNVSDWAKQKGMSTPMALFLIGAATGGLGARALGESNGNGQVNR